MRKVFVCCFVLCLVLFLSVFCFAQDCYIFTYVPDLGYVCNSLVPSGFYDLSCEFLNGFSAKGKAPVYFSFGPSGSTDEVSFYASVFDSSGTFSHDMRFWFSLSYSDGLTIINETANDPFSLSRGVFLLLPGVPLQDVSALMSATSGLFSSNFNTQNLLIVIFVALGVSVGLVLLWFVFGYIKRKLFVALRKGRV